MRLLLRVTLIAALASAGAPAVPAQDVGSIESDASALSLSHDPVTCMVANTYPQIEATLIPVPSVKVARVYFRSALGPDSYYVEMHHEAGRFVGTLPRPNANAGPVTYHVEGLGTDDTQTQSGETSAVVVEEARDCEGRVAPVAPFGSPVEVYSLTGSTAVPPGFSGVSLMLAAGAGTGAAAATGAGAGSFLTSTGGLILMGAAVVGIATAIVVSGGEEPPPASGSR